MDRPGEVVVRLVLSDLLRQKERVSAENYEFVAFEEAFHDLRHLAMEQRFAARDRRHRRAAFVDRLHALVIAQALIQYLVGIVDLAAARACEIAAEERLEHQNERIAFAAGQMLLEQVTANLGHLMNWNSHDMPRQFSAVRGRFNS